jgi:hypothetical protein
VRQLTYEQAGVVRWREVPDPVLTDPAGPLDLVSAGRLDPSSIPTRVVSWDDAEDGWLEPAVKLVVSRSA